MVKKLLYDEKNNSTVWEIESLENLNQLTSLISDNDICYYKNYTFKLKKVCCNIYGNPMYKFILSKNFENITNELKGLVYRAYISKGYSLIQSYNISDSIKRIFKTIEE